MTERIEKMRVSDDALDLVFRKARTYSGWLPKPVPEELLRQLYDTLKWGPTSANNSPARFVFIRSTAAKERLRPSLAAGNVQKTMAAPVTVIVAYDLKFYDKLPRLFPHYPAMRNMYVDNPTADPGNCAAELYLAGCLHDTCGAGSRTGLRSDVGL